MSTFTDAIHAEPISAEWQITICNNWDRDGINAFVESTDGHAASLACAEHEGIATDDWGHEVLIPTLVIARAGEIARTYWGY